MPSGLRRAVAAVTKRPEDADRFTARLLLVPLPARSVVVFPGHRAAVEFETKRPDLAERLIDPILGTSLLIEFGMVEAARAHWRAAVITYRVGR